MPITIRPCNPFSSPQISKPQHRQTLPFPAPWSTMADSVSSSSSSHDEQGAKRMRIAQPKAHDNGVRKLRGETGALVIVGDSWVTASRNTRMQGRMPWPPHIIPPLASPPHEYAAAFLAWGIYGRSRVSTRSCAKEVHPMTPCSPPPLPQCHTVCSTPPRSSPAWTSSVAA